jgi:hypothetical protein
MIITDFKLRQYAQEIGRILVNTPNERIVEIHYDFFHGKIPKEIEGIYPFNECEHETCSHINKLFFKIFSNIAHRIVPDEMFIKYRFKMNVDFDYTSGRKFDIENEEIEY